MSFGMPDALSNMNYNMNSTPSLLQPTASQQHIAATAAGNNQLYGLLTQGGAPLPQLPPLSSMQPIVTTPTAASTAHSGSGIAQPLITTMSTKASVAATTTTTTPAAATATTTTTTAAATTFNKALNNKPVEKLPPANVVITNSDPLPNPNSATVQTQQAPLSVTIPSHHIKSSVNVPPAEPAPAVAAAAAGSAPFGGFGLSGFSTNTFSFKPQVAQALQQQQQQISNTENDSEVHDKSASSVADADAEVEYDAHPDFKPIIPLPAEIEVKTGEEDEEIKFSSRAKLFRFVDKEWKERGIGDIKILKHQDGHSRILMRREQIHKICANHKIDGSLKLTVPNNETKGYIWAANDFADGTLQVEKFFIRFKLPESAIAFKAAFELAVKEAQKMEKSVPPSGSVSTAPATNFVLSKSANISNFATSTPAAKGDSANVFAVKNTATVTPTTPSTPSILSNFNLNSNAANNKNNQNNNNNDKGPSPFAGFTFGGGAATTGKPFASMFSISNMSAFPAQSKPSDVDSLVSSTSNETVTGAAAASALNKTNVSENGDDDYVPTAQFQPVISLPDLVEVNTGEENEIVLFEYRAKLLRFDKSTSEWKERGLGNIKLLQQKQNINEVRLLMRREQIHKLCCNQRIYKDTKFMLAKTASQNAVTWAGQDYSENELVTETMTLRFKTADITKDFLAAVKKAQDAMSAEGEENNAKNSVEKTIATSKNIEEAKKPEVLSEQGFGAQFKPKAGSWSCETCYISNKGDDLYCVACQTPKDGSVPQKPAQSALNVNGGTALPTTTFSFGFKNNAAPATSTPAAAAAATPAFVFAKPATNDAKQATPIKATSTTTTTGKETKDQGFGAQFKPKAGSWSCETCYISNKGDDLYCVACQTPKDSTVPQKEAQGVTLDVTPKFSFGFNANNTGSQNTTSTSSTTKTPLVFGQVTSKATTTTTTTSTTATKTNEKAAQEDVTKSFNFSGFNLAGSTASSSTTTTTTKPAFSFSLPTSSNDPTSSGSADHSITSPFALESSDFRFTMKSNKLNRSGGGGGDADALETNNDDNEYNEEENNTYFTPVIPLPDKIEVKTGEEDEEMLFVHRAKLYRFIEGEWKERGLGDIKILRHKETKKLRVVMRREQILKICLNHVLNSDVEYKPKDEKSWLFVVNDFSEGSIELEQFSLRFKTKEIANSFMDAVKDALAGTAKATYGPE